MKTFVINLDRNPERLAFMRRQLDGLGLAFDRFPAVCGKSLTPAERRARFSCVRSFVASKKRLSDAEIGVALSHVGCCRRLAESDESCALVLEDDVILGKGFPAALARAKAFIDPSRPQVVVFSGYGIANADTLPEEIRAEKSIWCADAYVLTRPAAELILRENDPVVTVADAFKRWHRFFGLELYRVLPATARQDDATFQSENQVLPKSNWILRNLLWIVDRLILTLTARRDPNGSTRP